MERSTPTSLMEGERKPEGRAHGCSQDEHLVEDGWQDCLQPWSLDHRNAELHFPGGWTLTCFLWPILLLRYSPPLELTYSFPEPSRQWGIGHKCSLNKSHLCCLHMFTLWYKELVFEFCISFFWSQSIFSKEKHVTTEAFPPTMQSPALCHSSS